MKRTIASFLRLLEKQFRPKEANAFERQQTERTNPEAQFSTYWPLKLNSALQYKSLYCKNRRKSYYGEKQS